jgi:hypothetical protein
MDQLIALVDLRTAPQNDASFIQECIAVWAYAQVALIKRPENWTPGLCVCFFQAFCRWRLRASRALITPHAKECGFIVTCALRLILMDSLSDLFTTALQLNTFRDLLNDWLHPLKDAEIEHLITYEHPEDTRCRGGVKRKRPSVVVTAYRCGHSVEAQVLVEVCRGCCVFAHC